jgi:peptidoglycan/xylan/chitin deacetylase (PgdA/CDA1 family)
MWDVEPDTYADQMGEGQEKVKFIVDYTLKHTLPGSIILMHPFCKTCESDRKALVEIIDGLKKEGYRFVTISELLTYQ